MVLLDKLYMHVHDAEANDVVVGGFAVLLKWLFVKAAVPFISVLSAVVSTGCKPYEDVDVHHIALVVFVDLLIPICVNY